MKNLALLPYGLLVLAIAVGATSCTDRKADPQSRSGPSRQPRQTAPAAAVTLACSNSTDKGAGEVRSAQAASAAQSSRTTERTFGEAASDFFEAVEDLLKEAEKARRNQ